MPAMRPSPDAAPAPLDPTSVEIHAVQFVGTNVEMTWRVDASEAEAEARTEALLASKLGLFALTPTGLLDGLPRFSVIASPLDRLFHKIGPSVPLTLIKHASVTLDLSEMNLARQGQGLVRNAPEAGEDGAALLKPWDAGKLVGTLLRRPQLLVEGGVSVAGVELAPRTFPDAILPGLGEHVEAHGGVVVRMEDPVRTALAG